MIVWDNAPCHRRKDLHELEGITLIHLPSYSSELNPAERYFEEIRGITANKIFKSLDKCKKLVIEAVNKWSDPDKLKQLLGYDWILEQCCVVS